MAEAVYSSVLPTYDASHGCPVQISPTAPTNLVPSAVKLSYQGRVAPDEWAMLPPFDFEPPLQGAQSVVEGTTFHRRSEFATVVALHYYRSVPDLDQNLDSLQKSARTCRLGGYGLHNLLEPRLAVCYRGYRSTEAPDRPHGALALRTEASRQHHVVLASASHSRDGAVNRPIPFDCPTLGANLW